MRIFIGILGGLAKLIAIPAAIVLGCVLLFALSVLVNVLLARKKGIRRKSGRRIVVKEHGFFRKILVDLPKQYANDYLESDPEFFRPQGVIIYTGRQGSGKTVSMIHDTRRLQQLYPSCKCLSNLCYTKQDLALNHWRQLIDFKNGHKGIVACIDELQNWFSSNQSKNFPPEMLQVITQNRKNRRVIFGTAQNFYLLAKAIRSQAVEVRECKTFLGCLTVVHRKEPVLDSTGDVVEWKNLGRYFFVHDKDLRESYDTYKVIESLASSGFAERDTVAA